MIKRREKEEMKGCLKCQGRMYQLGKLEPIIRGRKINEENEIKKKKKKIYKEIHF